MLVLKLSVFWCLLISLSLINLAIFAQNFHKGIQSKKSNGTACWSQLVKLCFENSPILSLIVCQEPDWEIFDVIIIANLYQGQGPFYILWCRSQIQYFTSFFISLKIFKFVVKICKNYCDCVTVLNRR